MTARVVAPKADEERGFVRTTIALTAAAGLLVVLAGCSTGAPAGDCTPTKSSGDTSSTITATGAFGADPEAVFPTPLISDGFQVSTISVGDGDVVYPGQYALTAINFFDGASGETRGSINDDSDSEPLLMRSGDGASNVGFAIECQTVGSRVAVSMSGADLWGLLNIDESAVGADEPVVVIIDIRASLLGKAYGTDQVPAQGLPAVVTAPDGTTGIAVPAGDAPTTVTTAVLKKSDGAELTAGDSAYLHFLRVNWDDPSSTKSTWHDFGSPSAFPLTVYDAATGEGIPAAIFDALVGQRIGSQVMVVIPPAYGFAEAAMPEGVQPGETLIYVFDILGIQPNAG